LKTKNDISLVLQIAHRLSPSLRFTQPVLKQSL